MGIRVLEGAEKALDSRKQGFRTYSERHLGYRGRKSERLLQWLRNNLDLEKARCCVSREFLAEQSRRRCGLRHQTLNQSAKIRDAVDPKCGYWFLGTPRL
jgi:hypothetical protein